MGPKLPSLLVMGPADQLYIPRRAHQCQQRLYNSLRAFLMTEKEAPAAARIIDWTF